MVRHVNDTLDDWIENEIVEGCRNTEKQPLDDMGAIRVHGELNDMVFDGSDHDLLFLCCGK